jgi:hypothetical protein
MTLNYPGLWLEVLSHKNTNMKEVTMGRFFPANRKWAFVGIALLLIFAAASPPASALPNTVVSFTSPPATEQNNSAVSLSEITPGEIYAVWSDFAAGFGTSTVNWHFLLPEVPHGGLVVSCPQRGHMPMRGIQQ